MGTCDPAQPGLHTSGLQDKLRKTSFPLFPQLSIGGMACVWELSRQALVVQTEASDPCHTCIMLLTVGSPGSVTASIRPM